jgi:DNA-binding SARP family transcriptional activator
MTATTSRDDETCADDAAPAAYTQPLVPIDAYEITLFGRPAIRHGDDEVTFSRSVELLFVRLALEPGRWVSREQLAEAVWEDEAERSEHQLLERDLRNPKHRLKTRLGALAEQVVEDDGTARMRLLLTDGSSIDTQVAETEAKRARDAAAVGDWQVARDAARRVEGIIGAELAAGRTERWIEAERRRFKEMGLEALAHLARAELSLVPPNPHAARDAARKLVTHDEANVDWLTLLMVAEFRSGKPHEAQEAYLAYARNCGPPPKQLRDLSCALADGDVPGLDDAWHLALPAHTRAPGDLTGIAAPASSVNVPAPRATRRKRVRAAATTTRRSALVGTLSAGGTLAATSLLAPWSWGPSAGTVALKALSAFESGDLDAIEHLLDPLVVFVASDAHPPHRAYPGRPETITRLRTIRERFTELKPTPDPILARGAVVGYKLEWRGYQSQALPKESGVKLKNGGWLTRGQREGPVRLNAYMEARVDGGLITVLAHTTFGSLSV